MQLLNAGPYGHRPWTVGAFKPILALYNAWAAGRTEVEGVEDDVEAFTRRAARGTAPSNLTICQHLSNLSATSAATSKKLLAEDDDVIVEGDE